MFCNTSAAQSEPSSHMLPPHWASISGALRPRRSRGSPPQLPQLVVAAALRPQESLVVCAPRRHCPWALTARRAIDADGDRRVAYPALACLAAPGCPRSRAPPPSALSPNLRPLPQLTPPILTSAICCWAKVLDAQQGSRAPNIRRLYADLFSASDSTSSG